MGGLRQRGHVHRRIARGERFEVAVDAVHEAREERARLGGQRGELARTVGPVDGERETAHADGTITGSSSCVSG